MQRFCGDGGRMTTTQGHVGRTRQIKSGWFCLIVCELYRFHRRKGYVLVASCCRCCYCCWRCFFASVLFIASDEKLVAAAAAATLYTYLVPGRILLTYLVPGINVTDWCCVCTSYCISWRFIMDNNRLRRQLCIFLRVRGCYSKSLH